MKRLKYIASILLPFFTVLLSIGCDIAGVAQISTALFVSPPEYDGTLYGPVGCDECQPTWHIAQWGIPVPLPNGWDNFSSGWEIGNMHGRIKYYNSSNTYEIAQNGTSGLACGIEYDLFLEPNSNHYMGYPSDFKPSKNLDTLKDILHDVGVQVVYEHVSSNCEIDYIAYITAMVFSNTINKQTLFYQIVFRDSRCIKPVKSWSPTLHGPDVFCVDDGIHIYGKEECSVNSGRLLYEIDILPRVKTVIKSGDYGIDASINNWKLEGVYFGQLLQGGVVATSQWDSYSLIVH